MNLLFSSVHSESIYLTLYDPGERISSVFGKISILK